MRCLIYFMAMIEIQHLHFSYAKASQSIFHDFNMQFLPGHIYGLLGTNGVGKSTLLYLSAGLLTPQKGAVLVNGSDVRQRKPETMQEIFVVPDEFSLPKVSLRDYIATNAAFYPRFSIDDMLHYLDVFGMNQDVNLSQLSLGQGKKVFMSFAMATHTHILLMDEPTNGLDIPGKEQFRRFLLEGRRADSIFVVSTHQVKDIEAVLSHVLVLDHNRIAANQSMESIAAEGTTDLELFFNRLMQTQQGGTPNDK